jgi:hypothetical protein
MKTQQIKNAVNLGRMAQIANIKRIPWQDQDLMEILKTHQANIPGSASFNELMEAWLTGWDTQNLIQ